MVGFFLAQGLVQCGDQGRGALEQAHAAPVGFGQGLSDFAL